MEAIKLAKVRQSPSDPTIDASDMTEIARQSVEACHRGFLCGHGTATTQHPWLTIIEILAQQKCSSFPGLQICANRSTLRCQSLRMRLSRIRYGVRANCVRSALAATSANHSGGMTNSQARPDGFNRVVSNRKAMRSPQRPRTRISTKPGDDRASFIYRPTDFILVRQTLLFPIIDSDE